MRNHLILPALCVLLIGCATMQPGEAGALIGLGADVATTAAGVYGDHAQEFNPLYAGSGDNAVLISAAVGLALHYLIRHYLDDKPAAYQRKIWSSVSIIRFGVAGWNVGQIAR